MQNAACQMHIYNANHNIAAAFAYFKCKKCAKHIMICICNANFGPNAKCSGSNAKSVSQTRRPWATHCRNGRIGAAVGKGRRKSIMKLKMGNIEEGQVRMKAGVGGEGGNIFR